jgi:hypothetical protein
MEKWHDMTLKSIATYPNIEKFQFRLCWQAHDDYYECISKQYEKDPGKYKLTKTI